MMNNISMTVQDLKVLYDFSIYNCIHFDPYCGARLANYKTPGQVEFVHALPRNAIGKIDKKEDFLW